MWSCLYVLKVCVCECEDMGSSAGMFACVCVRVCVCLCVCVDVYGRTAETVTTDESIFPTTENHLTYWRGRWIRRCKAGFSSMRRRSEPFACSDEDLRKLINFAYRKASKLAQNVEKMSGMTQTASLGTPRQRHTHSNQFDSPQFGGILDPQILFRQAQLGFWGEIHRFGVGHTNLVSILMLF